MLRSLHMKLVMLMVLLILSLMTVVGAFLINSVVAFYIQDFYSQMSTVFGDQEIVSDLRTAADGETDGAGALKTVLNAYAGQLGVDTRNRNFYILDGEGTSVLASSNGESGASGLSYTGNLMTAIESGQVGDESNAAADYMDVAIPIQRGGSDYIIYILDNKATVSNLNNQLFLLIMEALLFGLVISVLLSFLLSKTMITPIQRLTEGAMRVAEGDFAHKIEVASRDEIGVLTDTFNDMARQLRDTLRQVENERNKLDTLFLHMNDGVVAFSREGTVIHSNPAAAQMLLRRINHETTYDQLFGQVASLDQVLEVPDHLEGELRVRDSFLQLLMAPFDRGQANGGALVVIHDVTQQRKNEEMRREFVANVSHELRSPMTSMQGFLQGMLDGTIPAGEQRQYMQIVLDETRRLSKLVGNLLNLSRMENNNTELAYSDFDLHECIRRVIIANMSQLDDKHMDLQLSFEDEPMYVHADADQIEQVLVNLLSNAVKYTPEGGHIAIDTAQEGKLTRVVVRDDGPGVAPEDAPYIFDRFYKADKAHTVGKGMGLGLAICKRIMDKHGQSLRLLDTKEGAAFEFTLESGHAPEALPHAEEKDADPGKRQD